MRNLWYNDHYRTNRGKLFDQVNAELEKYHGSRYQNEDIEILGDIEGEYELITYGSRDLILAKYDGVTYATDEELWEYDEIINE